MTDITRLATQLWQARSLGHTIPTFDDPLTVDEGYAVQMAIAEVSGERRVGFKVGSTSKAAQARLGTDEPGAGVVLERFNFRDLGEGAPRVPIFAEHHLHVEAEFAFEMAALPARESGYTREEVIESISAFRPALEIVGCRFEDGLGNLGRALITADGGANVALVTGSNRHDWRAHELNEQPVELFINGEATASGVGAAALGHPLNVLEWLAVHLSRRGIDLADGDVVSTGTCTGLIAVAPGDLLRADFGDLGMVSARLVESKDG